MIIDQPTTEALGYGDTWAAMVAHAAARAAYEQTASRRYDDEHREARRATWRASYHRRKARALEAKRAREREKKRRQRARVKP